MNTFIQQQHKHIAGCIRVKVSQGTKTEVSSTKDRSRLAIFAIDHGHIFGSNVGNGFKLMLRAKRPHKPNFPTRLSHTLP